MEHWRQTSDFSNSGSKLEAIAPGTKVPVKQYFQYKKYFEYIKSEKTRTCCPHLDVPVSE